MLYFQKNTECNSSNWYSLVMSQIYRVKPTDGSGNFEQKLRNYYELEYKYHSFLRNEFTGRTERKVNTLLGLHSAFGKSIEDLIVDMKTVMQGWLDMHDLHDHDSWAIGRFKFAKYLYETDNYGDGESYLLDILLMSGVSHFTPIYELFQRVSTNTESYNSLNSILNSVKEVKGEDIEENIEYLEENGGDDDDLQYYKDRLIDLNGMTVFDMFEHIEDFVELESYFNLVGKSHSLTNQFILEVLSNIGHAEWANAMNEKEIDIESVAYGVEENLNSLTNIDMSFSEAVGSIRKEWDVLRDNPEKIFEILNKSGISEASATVNLAINSVHSAGKIFEDRVSPFLGEHFDEELLDELSNYDTSEWDQELRDNWVVA